MDVETQRLVLEAFLNEKKIKLPVAARLSHLGRKVRQHFPGIASVTNPDGKPWRSVQIRLLAEHVATLDPDEHTPVAVVKPKIPAKRAKQLSQTQMFLRTPAWRQLRYEVLVEQRGTCQCCGLTQADGAKIQVDHIKPISKRWDLRLVKSNLQVLCRECNKGKSNRDTTDWRTGAAT